MHQMLSLPYYFVISRLLSYETCVMIIYMGVMMMMVAVGWCRDIIDSGGSNFDNDDGYHHHQKEEEEEGGGEE
jgi:hypothetical protein